MSDQFIGEVRLVGFNFKPENWDFCAGQTIAISQNEALYSLIGTFYGGDGTSTFQLPDLRGRVPIHQGSLAGNTYVIGQAAGGETVGLITQHMPTHDHAFQANPNPPTSDNPLKNTATNNTLGAGPEIYETKPPGIPMGPMLTVAGGSVPHNNMQPYLVLNWIIALYGIFPTHG
jgi:microcystin-dependent protein